MSAFDFETNIESASIEFLSDATGLSVDSFYASLEQDNLVLPRISVRCEIEGAEDPPTDNSAGDIEYSQYEATLSIIISSDASVDGTQTSHRDYREKVRRAMLRNSANWSGADLSIRGAGISSVNVGYDIVGVDNDKDQYRSYNGDSSNKIQIRWSGTRWEILKEFTGIYYSSEEDVITPDLVTTWEIEDLGLSPTPIVSSGWDPLSYYEVKYMRPSGTDFETDGDLAISTLTYALKFTVNPDSY